MCETCGCGDAEAAPRVTTLEAPPEAQLHAHPHGHAHDHPHSHPHAHPHAEHRTGAPDPTPPAGTETLTLEQDVLAKNDDLAEVNRQWLRQRQITAVNLMSSPGSGKTSLLERTIREVGASREVGVIEGDQETLLDARRIRAAGARATQINTGAGCHLDAEMLSRGLEALAPTNGSVVFVENVGNLVCPALFDLGEASKVVVISVTEGDDKPLKYPLMFAAADLIVVNKTDLLPYVDFDVAACERAARGVNPQVELLPLSVRTGSGIDSWYRWLDETG
ncbi:MAG: hydrogenase nickel incorporation protein HypB [Nocardioidaceae bacterium]